MSGQNKGKVTFKTRTGKDLFDFMKRSEIDSKAALFWAMEEFVLIDDRPIDVVDISKLSDRAYLLISSKVFTYEDPSIYEDNQGIHYKNYLIKNRRMHRDFVTQLQTEIGKYKNNSTGLMSHCICLMFEVDSKALDSMPYQLVAFLINKCSHYLSQLTTPSDELIIDEIWSDSTGIPTNGELGDLVSGGDKIPETN